MSHSIFLLVNYHARRACAETTDNCRGGFYLNVQHAPSATMPAPSCVNVLSSGYLEGYIPQW